MSQEVNSLVATKTKRLIYCFSDKRRIMSTNWQISSMGPSRKKKIKSICAKLAERYDVVTSVEMVDLSNDSSWKIFDIYIFL